MNKLQELIQQHGLSIVVYLCTFMWFASNMETRLAYAEREITNIQTLNATVYTLTARVAVLESEIKANSRMVEQVYGYVKATDKAK